MKRTHLLLLLFPVFLWSCREKDTPPTEQFRLTWYAGKAEITSYALEQARYGELRKGSAVLIFVTEDFSTKKLVKLDDPGRTSNKKRVLKMNATREFNTGIYPYSMMTSVFTPVSPKLVHSLKVTGSAQEWCGHTFAQLRLSGNDYNYKLFSYFEKETDADGSIGAALLEDEIWNQIRINPAALATGKALVVPGFFYQRFTHRELRQENAELTLSRSDTLISADSNAQMYTVHYPGLQRTLKIYFQQAFPHQIFGWTDTYPDGIGAQKKMLTSRAYRKQTTWLDYWKHNAAADRVYRDSLQLPHYAP